MTKKAKKDIIKMQDEKKAELRIRISTILPDLPANYVEWCGILDPKMKDPEWKYRIRGVKNFNAFSEEITILLEKVAVQFKKATA